MTLSPAEIKRRIAAARTLRGITQAELQETLADQGYGLGSQELGRIERGILPLTGVRRRAIAEALRVPETWLTVENVDEIVGLAKPTDGPLEALVDRVDRLHDLIEETIGGQLLREIDALRAALRDWPPPAAADQ